VTFIHDKNIVITGGAGFIGSNLAETLAKDNTVTIIDDLSTGRLINIQPLLTHYPIRFVEGSILDLPALTTLFKDTDYVFHEAAIPSVPRSVRDPVRSNLANVNGTLNVLVAARDNHIEKLVYASSSSVYGDTPTLPKHEAMTPMPLSPYAVSKLTGEHYCQVFNTVYGLHTVSLRYFNVFGSHQDPKSEYAAVIPKFLTSALTDQSPLIYGDGEQTRDFTFVSDVVNANILAASTTATGTFNIAGGRRISINTLASTILALAESTRDVTHAAPRSGDIKHSLADITKAKKEIGYEPQSTIEKGLKETITWFQTQT
jgi:UDP-glucose 4-epimerase